MELDLVRALELYADSARLSGFYWNLYLVAIATVLGFSLSPQVPLAAQQRVALALVFVIFCFGHHAAFLNKQTLHAAIGHEVVAQANFVKAKAAKAKAEKVKAEKLSQSADLEGGAETTFVEATPSEQPKKISQATWQQVLEEGEFKTIKSGELGRKLSGTKPNLALGGALHASRQPGPIGFLILVDLLVLAAVLDRWPKLEWVSPGPSEKA